MFVNTEYAIGIERSNGDPLIIHREICMKPMAKIVVAFAALFFCHNIVKAQPSGCDDCPPPFVTIYGLQMNVTQPPTDSTGRYSTVAEENAFLNWVSLGDVFVSLAAIENNDPEKGCVRWSDGSLASQISTLADTLVRVHLQNYWSGDIPPNGSIPGVDYLIWAALDSSGGQYHFHVYLEDGYSRAQIAAGNADFANAAGAEAAAATACSSIEPVFDKIRTFQKNLRNNDNTVALSAQITVTPSQPSVNGGQTIPVMFQVSDCDGTDGTVPLANRTLNLTATKGTFNPINVQTDENGNATSNFTAGSTGGVATLKAVYYPYFNPSHKTRGSSGNAIVAIGEPLVNDWELDVTEHLSSDDHKVNDDPANNYYYFYDDRYQSDASYKVYMAGIFTDTSITNDKSLGGGGNVTISETKKILQDEVADYYTQTQITDGGISKDADFTLQPYLFGLPSQLGGITFTSAVYTDGASFVKTYEKSNSGTTENDTSGTWTDGVDLYPIFKVTTNSTFSGGDSSYLFTGDSHNDTVIVTSATETETRSYGAHVTVVVRPYKTPTGVRSTANMLPNRYWLYENYPNPFNPSTIISYEIPAGSLVTLSVYDVLGRKVTTLVNARQNAGKYTVSFSGNRLSSGVYFYRLRAGSYVMTKKMLLMQ